MPAERTWARLVLMTHPMDAADPLATFRDRFVGSDSTLVYLDGNSLGRPLEVTPGTSVTSCTTSGAAG